MIMTLAKINKTLRMVVKLKHVGAILGIF